KWVRDNTVCDAFNLGTGTGYSVLDLIKALEKASGKTLPITYTPRRAGDIAACYADPTKAREFLHWEAQLGVDKMCADAWNFAIRHQ
ncbi:MAG: UDP-glucose 4-epimerase, partial [Clostridia bacterium]|nr:UDP-glucose 4-epimerase [Clostridia bacterium]